MFSQWGLIEICCDAPPCAVVRVCHRVGFRSPLDVRWCRLSNFRSSERRRRLGLWEWKRWLGVSQPREETCSCGESLPLLQRYAFTFSDDEQAGYLLGQCRRCRTMFWDEA
jgi:hypothetical protein